MPWLAPLRAASTKDASGAAVVAVDRAQRLSGRDAASPTEKAARYLREKEFKLGGGGGGDPGSRLADAATEYGEEQQALFLSSPSGLGMGAEAAIARSIAEGALDNLKGKGKPLKGEDHGAQFYRVDPLMQAMTRTMGAQNLRPLSLELRDELAAAVASLRQQLHHELRAALEVERQQQRQRAEGAREGSNIKETHAAGAPGGSSGGGGSWVSRLLGLGESAAAGGSSAGSSSRHSVEAIREGRHPGLQHAADEVAKLVRLYNSAVLADKETLGSHWPLNQSKQLKWEEEVASALAELK